MLFRQVIPTFDMAINEVFFERYPDTVLEHQIQVRPFNADKTRNMRALNPEGEQLRIPHCSLEKNLLPNVKHLKLYCNILQYRAQNICF